MPDFNRLLILATAAKDDLEATIQHLRAATLRGDELGARRLRQQAHDILDACLDLQAQSAVALRMQIGG